MLFSQGRNCPVVLKKDIQMIRKNGMFWSTFLTIYFSFCQVEQRGTSATIEESQRIPELFASSQGEQQMPSEPGIWVIKDLGPDHFARPVVPDLDLLTLGQVGDDGGGSGHEFVGALDVVVLEGVALTVDEEEKRAVVLVALLRHGKPAEG